MLALVVVATALAAMLAPAASAQAPQPDPRAEAQALGRMALDTRAKLRARAPVVASGLKRFDRFSARCPALERADGRAPRLELDSLGVALTAHFSYGPILGTLDRFAGDLEAAAVTDSALRGGVAGWRATVRGIQTFVQLPAHLCAAIRRWARSGYAPARAPVSPANVVGPDDTPGKSPSDAIDRASRRLRELGASARAAKAFTVDGLLEATWRAMEESEVGSSESAASDFAEFCHLDPGAC